MPRALLLASKTGSTTIVLSLVQSTFCLRKYKLKCIQKAGLHRVWEGQCERQRPEPGSGSQSNNSCCWPAVLFSGRSDPKPKIQITPHQVEPTLASTCIDLTSLDRLGLRFRAWSPPPLHSLTSAAIAQPSPAMGPAIAPEHRAAPALNSTRVGLRRQQRFDV
jgi:hypothetical protein